MTDEVNTKKMPRKKLFAMLAAVVLIAGGITLTSVSVANANAEETARLCTAATKGSATKEAKASIAMADAALEAVTALELPNSAGTSTSYAARPGIQASKAITGTEASDGIEAVAGVDAVAARSSGAELTTAVTKIRAALVKIKIPTECSERDQAATITAKATDTTKATKALDTNVETLLADFTAFQSDEAARIATEIEAARVAAEIEAMRVAAEAEAARVAAAAESARLAAEQAAYSSNTGSSYSTGGTSSGGSSSSGGGTSSGRGSSGTPGGGGGGLDLGPPTPGICWTSNGMGGSMPC